MNTWKRWVNKVVSAVVLVSTVATGAGVVTVRPVAAAVPERQPGAYLPVRWRGQGADEPPFVVYLPVVMRTSTPPAPSEAIIEPGVGGQIGSPDGDVQIGFLPESVESPTVVRYQDIEPPLFARGMSGVGGPAFTLSAWDAGTGTPVTEFTPLTRTVSYQVAPAVTVTDTLVTPTVKISIRYTDQDVWGLDKRTLSLYTRQEADEPWRRIPTAVDPDRRTLVAEITHFSDFVVAGELAAQTTGDRVCLDPDHGPGDSSQGHALWDGVTYWEAPLDYQMADAVRERLESRCELPVVLTRGADEWPSRDHRIEVAVGFEADVMVLLAFNTYLGVPWGDETNGGPLAYVRPGHLLDSQLGTNLNDQVYQQTGRLTTRGVLDYLKYPAYSVLPDDTSYSHAELLFMDHNYDWPVISDPEGFGHIADAVYNAILLQLGLDDATCQLAPPPSPELIQRWRNLGYQNYQRYGGDPVSFSTGNHVVQVQLLRVPGRGGLDLDFTLTYNSQDGRDGSFGYGWTMPYDVRVTLYRDDSVDVRHADGRTHHYTWNGSGYDPPAGVHDVLVRTATGWQLTTPDETTYTFEEMDVGEGRLVELRDRRGNSLTFTYEASGEMTGVSDGAGRAVTLHYTDGHVTQIDDFAGRSYSFEYTDGDLTAITDANGGARRFQYDERHRMTHEWDEEDYLYLQSVYDDRDRVIEQIDAGSTHSFFDYDPINRVTIFTDNLGHQEVYHWDELDRVTGEQDASGAQVTNEYDADYNLVAVTDANGHTTRYTYDDRGNVTSRTDPLDGYSLYASDVTRWAYDEHNLVISMTNALDDTWLYAYDEHGNLVHTVAPDGSQTWAAYNAWGQPLVITDAVGHATRYVYDTYGNRIHTIDPAGNVVTSTYDLAGRETSYTDANGHAVHFEYDGNDNVTRIVDPRGNDSTFQYDGNDLLTRSVDRRDAERLYRYDENLKLVAERDPEGNWTTYGYDDLYRRVVMTDALGSVTRYAYDEAGRLLSVTDPLSATTRYEYDAVGNQTAVIDPLGHRTRMVYDASNRIKYLVDAGGNRTEYCYDAEDQLIRTIGPRGEVTDYTYDPLGRLVAVRDPLGNVTEYEYDPVGNRIAEIDPLGHRTDYSYDGVDRLVAVARPELPSGDRPTTRYTYDGVGNTLVITSPRGFATTYTYDGNDNVLTVTDPLGGETSYTYDDEDNPVMVTDASGHPVTTTYNLADVPVQVEDAMGYTSTMVYDAAYNLVQRVDALGRATVYEYDPLGRLLSQTDPLSNATVYARDALGRVTAVTDANGHATAYDYDGLGRLVGVTDALGGVTQYGYDEVGNLTTITDANGHVTTFEYNFLNQLKRETNPLVKSWWYSYDGAGRLVRRVDAMWRATYYDYDSNDRLVAVSYGTTPPEMHPVTFTYDLEGNETTMCDALGCTAHAYDALGRRTSTIDWLGRTITRTYDAVGNLTGLAYPNSYEVTYGYNANDWLIAFTDPHGGSSTFDHNPLGQVTQIQHPNGTRAELSRDDAGRLLDLVNRGPGGAVQSAYHYMLDRVGNRVQVAEERAPFSGLGANVVLTHTYEYDALDRLVRAATEDPATDTAYTFDAVGNRLAKTGTILTPDPGVPELPVAPRPEAVTYAYNEANQLTAVSSPQSTVGLDYNGNGDRVRETEVLTDGTTLVTGYAYDREDRLVGATKSVSDTAGITVTMVATYTYDGYGRRALKTVTYPGGITPTQVITYLYDGLDIIGAQLAQGAIVTETYYYLAPSPVTGLRRPLEMERLPNPATAFAGDRYWYQSDGLDSVVALTDEAGDLASPYLYDEYGQMLAGTNDLQILAYTAQQCDHGTRFLQFYARYYDPARGSWLTQDVYRGSVDTPFSLMRYVYVLDNPVSEIDYFGFEVVYSYDTPCLNGQKECTPEEIQQEIEKAEREYAADIVDLADLAYDKYKSGHLSADGYAATVLIVAKLLDRKGRCQETIKVMDATLTAKNVLDLVVGEANPYFALLSWMIKCPGGDQPDGQPCGTDEVEVISGVLEKSATEYIPTMLDIVDVLTWPLDKLMGYDSQYQEQKAKETWNKVWDWTTDKANKFWNWTSGTAKKAWDKIAFWN